MAEDNQQQDSNAESEKISLKDWTQNETGRVLDYCSRNNLGLINFVEKQSAILPPIVAVWLVDSRANKEKFWVISGEVPLDHIPVNVAKSAREAIRYFALNWQLKAERLMHSLVEGKPQLGDNEKQTQFANTLIKSADMLYDMAEKNELWENHLN